MTGNQITYAYCCEIMQYNFCQRIQRMDFSYSAYSNWFCLWWIISKVSWHVALSNNSCMLFQNADWSFTNHFMPNEIYYVAKIWNNWRYFMIDHAGLQATHHFCFFQLTCIRTVTLDAWEKCKARSRICSKATGKVFID